MTKKTCYICVLALTTILMVLSGCANSSSGTSTSSLKAGPGVDVYKVKFLEEDTQYSPQLEVQHYNEIHTKVAMIADSLGTPTTFAIKDLATSDHMLISAATLSSALAREKYLVMVG